MTKNEMINNFVEFVNKDYLHIDNYCKNINDAYDNIEIDDYEWCVETFCDNNNINCHILYNLINEIRK